MKKLINLISHIIIIFPAILFALYLFYLFVLPGILNSARLNNYIEKKVFEKTGIEIETYNLKFKTYKTLSISAIADKIELINAGEKILEAENFDVKIRPLFNEIASINIDYIYADKNCLRNLIKTNNKPKHKKFHLKSIPFVNIKKAEIFMRDDKQNITNIVVENFFINNRIGYEHTFFNADIDSTYLKHHINIDNNNNIRFTKMGIEFDNLNIESGDTDLYINGKTGKDGNEISLNGEDIPLHDIQSSLLYYLKLKNPKKNFMENFYDYSGKADIHITINSDGVNGRAFIENLSAKSVKFDVPIKFNDFPVIFEQDTIKAQAYGKLGYEDVYADFSMSGYQKEKRVIDGKVHSVVTSKSAEKYLPRISIDGGVDSTVSYHIEKSVPHVFYLFKLNKGSNLYFKSAGLGLVDDIRQLYISTSKYPDRLVVDSYDYSTINDNIKNKIITGDAMFEQVDNKLKIAYITCQTENPAPVSVAGSFGKRLEGGYFSGKLKYDYKKSLLTGRFNLSNSKFKDFKIKSADIVANEKIAEISSTGTYNDSPYKCYINMDNRFKDFINVHKIDLFLDKFVIKEKTNKPQIKNIKNSEIAQKAKEYKYTIEDGTIKLNKFIYKKIIVKNINASGTLNNNIAHFQIHNADFADGKLKAIGAYNINSKISEVDFSADNIDSNSAATMIFNFPDEIYGTANATLHAKINNHSHDIDAHAKFSLKDGFLKKLGSTEYMLKGSKHMKKPLKIRITNFANTDISESKAKVSDIEGSFDWHNKQISNANIFSKNRYLSLFIEGDYKIDDEYADLKLWGRYDINARKMIKICFLPLSVIMKVVFKAEHTRDLYNNKLQKIPPIKAGIEDTEFFSVSVKGNLNHNKAKIQLRTIE